MSLIRTDLAMEAHEIAAQNGAVDGVLNEEETRGDVKITKVKVLDTLGSAKIGKPIGTYVTVETGGLEEVEGESYENAITAISDAIAEMLKPCGNGLVLVAGLGNNLMTPDALGPKTIEKVLVTRHVAGELTKIQGFENMRAVAAIAPGVLGQTGVETGEIIRSLVVRLQPVAVIAIDALASRKASRLGTTIQIADTGIIPGSGIGNTRNAINKASLGVPVISLGVPTVVDAATLAVDLLKDSGIETNEQDEETLKSKIDPSGSSLFVTPRMIDLIIEHSAKITAKAINRALHQGVNPADIEQLVG